MSEGSLIAIVGVGATLIGAFLQPLLAAAVAQKSNLLVTVSLHQFSTPEIVKSLIRSAQANNSILPLPPHLERALDRLKYFLQFLDVRITNTGKKEVNNITVSIFNNKDFMADVFINSEFRDTISDKYLRIDSLQPGAKCRIYIWQPSINDSITVTASSYDKITYKHSINHNNINDYFHIKKSYMTIFTYLLAVFTVAYWFLVLRQAY